MKILIDVDALEKDGVLTRELAEQLCKNAVRQTGSTAINMLLAFGAIAAAAGMLALNPTPSIGALFGFGFILVGLMIFRRYKIQWGKLGNVWMVVGSLLLAGSVAILINQPIISPLAVAAILASVGVIAESRLLIALTPLSLASAIGGSAGYWDACYMITVEEPFLTIIFFSLLAFGAWEFSKRLNGVRYSLSITFARMCVILVNFGFWVGSLWGDTPAKLWRSGFAIDIWRAGDAEIKPLIFILAWAFALIAAGAWGAKKGRRFMVNTVAVFGSIEFYTEWFEYLGMHPYSVIVGGVSTIAFGLGLWRYNRAVIS